MHHIHHTCSAKYKYNINILNYFQHKHYLHNLGTIFSMKNFSSV